MSEIRYNLKDKNASNKTMIMATLCFHGERIRFTTGLSINPKYWNSKSNKARELLEYKDATVINERLNQINGKIISLYNNHLLAHTLPDKATLKSEILTEINHGSTVSKPKSFWELFDDFVDFKRSQLNDVRDYHNSLRKHLKSAEIEFKRPITIASLKDQPNGCIDTFNHYLKYQAKGADGAIGMSLNTIGKQHKNLKVFLNWCFDKGIHDRFSLKHIVTETEDVEKVYLTKEELLLIESHKCKGEELIVRDLFIIGCETGLRYSDLTSLNEEHIQNDQIHIRPVKTRGSTHNKLIIPMSDKVKQIVKRHKGFPIYTGKLVDFNKSIRNMAKSVGIDSLIINEKSIAGKHISTKNSKHELISSHTCRRTFCTIKFLDGMPVQAIMKFSGHKTERAFMRYLKLDAELTAVRFSHFF